MSKKALDDVDERDLEAARLWRAEAGEIDTDEPVEVVVKRPPARKDTKHWCRGKVGREHTLAIEIPPNAWRQDCRWVTNIGDRPYWSCVHVEMCTACGKQLRHSYGWLRDNDARGLRPEECPAYAPRPTEPDAADA